MRQVLSISPDAPTGTPALQGALSDPSTSTNIPLSVPSADPSEPELVEGERGREVIVS